MTSSPPGPVYDVASSVLFQCDVDSDLNVTYDWTLHCEGDLLFQLQNTKTVSLLVLSTSTLCTGAITVTCSVRDGSGREGESMAVIGNVTGR